MVLSGERSEAIHLQVVAVQCVPGTSVLPQAVRAVTVVLHAPVVAIVTTAMVAGDIAVAVAVVRRPGSAVIVSRRGRRRAASRKDL